MTDNEDEGVGQVDLVENLRHTEIDIDLWDDDQPETPPANDQEPETTPKLPTAPTNSFADLTQEELLVLKDNLHLYPKHKQIQILEILDVLAERKKAKRRRENLLDFIKYVDPDYKVGKHHNKLATLLEDMAFGRKDRVMVNIAPRFGKLVADETPVLTPGGWTTHGELKVGDEVFHPSGKPIKVLAVSGKGPADIEMMFTTEGEEESVFCHDNHEWVVKCLGKPYKFEAWKSLWCWFEDGERYELPSVVQNEGRVTYLKGSKENPQNKIGHCIQVDSPDGLYLIGKTLIPTHNSQLTSIYFPAWFVGNFPHKNIIMVSHTSDLAVEFGRKVRNIVDSEAYRDTFPGVALAADSKAAGRWATNGGGSYYACGIGGALAGRGSDLLCIALNSKVFSKERGEVRADSVMLGEHLLGFGGFNKVEKIFHSQSTEEVEIDGAVMTPNHPVWTFNRGWVVAGLLTTDDLLDTISLWSYIRLHGEIYYGQSRNAWRKLFKGLQHLGDDEAAVYQSECVKLRIVRRAGDKVLRSMEVVRELLGRYGVPFRRNAYAGQNRQRRGLYPGELSMGGQGNASLQSAQWSQINCLWTNPIPFSMGKENRANERPTETPHRRNETASRGSAKSRSDELGAAPRKTNEFGWLKRSAFRLLGGSWQKNWDQTGIVMGGLKAASRSKICGLLLGVRRLSKVEHRCGSSTQFVNFQVSDSNTFYCNAWMTHNCIDDPHNEQEVLSGNYEVFERAYDWYAYGARTRLSPTGVVAIVATRWAENDLTGKLIQDMTRNPGSDQWEVVEFPAILDVEEEVKDENGISTGDTKIVQKSLWPEQWSLESLLRTKASMPPFQWSAQYMQQPTSKDSAIVKREWWQKWEAEEPPTCEYVIMSLDAAAEKNNRSDYTSLSTWGVFYKENDEGIMVANIILLNAIKARWEFPELKRRAYKEYREWNPDWFLVEKKSAGVALYQEMRAAGIPVQEVTPTRYSGDKVARLNSVCDIFSSGLVWYPAGRRWAEDLVDEVCGFPAMPQDDQVDTCVYSLMRFRSGGFITLPTDRYDEDEPEFRPRRPAYY